MNYRYQYSLEANKKKGYKQTKKIDPELESYIANLKRMTAMNNSKHGQRQTNDMVKRHYSKDRIDRSYSNKRGQKKFNSSRRTTKSAVRSGYINRSSKDILGSDQKRSSSNKRSRHNLNRSSKASLRSKEANISKDNYYSDKKKGKLKKIDKRSMSNGLRKGKDIYFTDQTKSSPGQSGKKDRSAYIRYEDNTMLSSKNKSKPYVMNDSNCYFSTSGACPRITKQHNFLKHHVDHKIPSNSFHCNMPTNMFSPSHSSNGMNQSALFDQIKLNNNHLKRSKRINCFNKQQDRNSRQHNHYRINSSSNTNKAGDSRSSSVLHPSELTPLNSNYTKTVKTKHTNEDTLVGSNVYKVSTMENSIKKNYKQSLNLSSNQYNDNPTTAEWHSSLVNGDDNIEEIHYFFVMFCQK